MGKVLELTGLKFEKLTVIERSNNTSGGKVKWKCVCECGKVVLVCGSSLKVGKTKSCGCYSRDLATKHGQGNIRTPTYISWGKMKTRCLNPNYIYYKNYGGRGIKICDRWLGDHGFENFLSDMGKRPSNNHSLDRYPDANGDYEPSNCRWATRSEQDRNRTNNVWVEYEGERLVAADWAARINIPYRIVLNYIKRGYSIDRIINKYKPRKIRCQASM